MIKGAPATIDDAIVAVALGECEYPVARSVAELPPRDAILAMTPEERRGLIDMDLNRELIGEGVQVFEADIAVGELDDCYYRVGAPWTAFTSGTHRVRDGAKEFDELDDFTRRRVEWSLEQDGPYQPLLVVSPTEEGPFVIAHGAARVTAHVRRYAPDHMLDAYWLIAADATKWPWWPSATEGP